MSDENSGATQSSVGSAAPSHAGRARRLRLAVFVTTMTVTLLGCQGTDGPILRSMSNDVSSGGAAGGAMPGSAGAGSVLPPTPMVTWQIQLAGTVDTSVDAELYIIDFESPQQVFDELRTGGRTVMCFFSAGTLEPWRSDADALPASAVGEPVVEYPDEQWLDVRDPTVAAVMVERIQSVAAGRCDGVLPANIDGFLNATGFALTLDHQIDFNRLLAARAHQAGLSIGLSGGNGSLVEALATDYDWGFAVDCVAGGCSHLGPLVAASQPVFVAEYADAGRADTICARAAELGLNAILKNPELDAARVACQ